jgi:hypothetical protein
VPDGPITQYFTFHTLEEAKLLDVERLNANKPKGRPGERVPEHDKFPCPYGCGGTFKKSGLTRHTKVCGRGLDEYSNSPQHPQFKIEVGDSQNGAALDQQAASMMVTAHDPATGKMVWQCTQCSYSNKLKFTVKEHVETHIGGITHTCPHCAKTCPTRNALRVHTIRNHSGAPKTPVVAHKSNPHAGGGGQSPMQNRTVQNQQALAVARAFGDLDNPKRPKEVQQQQVPQKQHQQYQQPQKQHQQQSTQSSSSSQSQKPRLKPPKVEYQPQPPSAHMGHTNRPLMNQPAFPGQPRGPYEDNSSQHSEDNNAQYTEELNRLLQQSQDTTRQQTQAAPYPGVPGYGLPMWPFYRQ